MDCIRNRGLSQPFESDPEAADWKSLLTEYSYKPPTKHGPIVWPTVWGPYPTLPYPTLPYSTLPYSTLPYSTLEIQNCSTLC